MNRSNYRGKHKTPTIRERSKIYASRTLSLVLAFVLTVGLMPGLSYADTAAEESPLGEADEALVDSPEQTAEPAEEQPDASEGTQQQEGQQPEPQDDQQEGLQPSQQQEAQQSEDEEQAPSESASSATDPTSDAELPSLLAVGGGVPLPHPKPTAEV